MKFFVKYHTELPEVLSCLVHFVVINYLKIYTVSEIENLKFGDFIHHEDKHGEYFLPSKRLQKIYASNNRQVHFSLFLPVKLILAMAGSSPRRARTRPSHVQLEF